MTQNEKDFLNYKDIEFKSIEPIKSSEEDEQIETTTLCDECELSDDVKDILIEYFAKVKMLDEILK